MRFESGRCIKWGSLQHSSRPASWIWVLRKGREEKGKKGERKEREEKRQTRPKQKNSGYGPNINVLHIQATWTTNSKLKFKQHCDKLQADVT